MLSTPLGKLNALIECFYYCHSDIAVICKVLNCKLFPLVTYSGGVEVRYVCGSTTTFMDDRTFGCSGAYGETWRLNCEATTMSGVAIPGWSLMSMNACLVLWC